MSCLCLYSVSSISGSYNKSVLVLFSGVDSLFNKINCDRSAITDMLGGKSGATDANMMQVRLLYISSTPVFHSYKNGMQLGFVAP